MTPLVHFAFDPLLCTSLYAEFFFWLFVNGIALSALWASLKGLL